MNGAIFDMDGLMFDTERVHIQAWDYAAEKLGWDCPGIEMVRRTLGMSIAAAEEVWRSILGEKYDREKLGLYSQEYMTQYFAHNSVPIKDGLPELLTALRGKGYRLAVASSTHRDGVMRNLRSAGIENTFDAVISGEMVVNSKPAPDIFLKACEAIGCAPEDCFAFEDSRNGLLSALSAGCRTVMVPDLWEGEAEIDARLFAKCDSLRDFIALI